MGAVHCGCGEFHEPVGAALGEGAEMHGGGSELAGDLLQVGDGELRDEFRGEIL